jgi:hypothetical protein
MSEMSPLARLILRAMRLGAVGAAGFVVLVIGIETAKRWTAGGLGAVSRGDIGFFAVLVALLFGALYLARSITRELRNSGP